MNRARLPQPNELHDDHRPPLEYWGPIPLHDDAGTLRDIAEPSLTAERPDCCAICSSRLVHPVAVVYGYPLFHCEECDVGFVWPQPSDDVLQKYYGPQYWSTYMNDTSTLYERQPVCDQIFRRQAQYFDRLMGRRKDARILDVGAGDGTMLKLLQDYEYQNAQGIDLDAENCQRAKERLGVNVQHADFLKYQESGWDAITMWAVIEHLKSPRQYVEHAFQLLKPGGVLVMMTGDNDSACAKLQGCFDMWLYPPEHLFFFGRLSLWHLLRSAGFRYVFVRAGYQSWLKEQLLTAQRLIDSFCRLLKSSTRPRWRSTASNLLVVWGRKEEPAGSLPPA